MPNQLVSVSDPARYQALVKIVDTAPAKCSLLKEVVQNVGDYIDRLEADTASLAQANDALGQAVSQSLRRRPSARDEIEDLFSEVSRSNDSFISILYGTTNDLLGLSMKVVDDTLAILEGPSLAFKDAVAPRSVDQYQGYAAILNLNQGALVSYINGVLNAVDMPVRVAELSRKMVGRLDRYYSRLNHRHTIEGIEIHRGAIVTDIAMTIFENVDSHGEIQDGKNPDEVSAYSISKAGLFIELMHNSLVEQIIKDPKFFIAFIKTVLQNLWEASVVVAATAAPIAEEIKSVLQVTRRTASNGENEYRRAMGFMTDLDPQNIYFRDRKGLQTAEERYELTFKNESIRRVAVKLGPSVIPQDLVKEILARKQELRNYYQEENSFYVCKIGNGNQFTGEAPGALSVVPGVKPNVDLNEIVGTGFDQVQAFITSIQDSMKWHDLFVATSPSKSADKANALLIGPQGCGKSEALRAVGGDRKAIGIYAQPSDFLTCWKGEAEKNPKRLFEGALRLQKESGKQVYILLDEVDTILNDDHARGGFGGTNLTTEFQQLMDGILQYPHIAVWAATNHPERIPMPMIRRFNKVAVVGELTEEDRIKLLKQFINYLPVSDSLTAEAWTEASKKLAGCVGDGIRKIADHVWRENMAGFVRTNPSKAEELTKWLNRDTKFSVSKFNGDARRDFQRKLREHVTVSPESLMNSINLHLENVAFQAEMATAVETYDRAKLFLAGIKAQAV